MYFACLAAFFLSRNCSFCFGVRGHRRAFAEKSIFTLARHWINGLAVVCPCLSTLSWQIFPNSTKKTPLLKHKITITIAFTNTITADRAANEKLSATLNARCVTKETQNPIGEPQTHTGNLEPEKAMLVLSFLPLSCARSLFAQTLFIGRVFIFSLII